MTVTLSNLVATRCAPYALLLFCLVASACGGTAERSAPAVSNPDASTPVSGTSKSRPKIVCLGDSLTAGYGLAKKNSFPSLLQSRLDASGYDYEVVNAGVSGDTSAGGARRVAKALEGEVAVLIVELGGNDGLRGLPPDKLKENLLTVVRAGKAKGAKVLLTGMEAPPNLGPQYTGEFRRVFADIAEDEDVELLPFFLEGVAGRLEYNQPDGIHPNEQGAEKVTDLVWEYLEPMLEE